MLDTRTGRAVSAIDGFRKLAAAAGFMLLLAGRVTARDPAFLVKDINTGPDPNASQSEYMAVAVVDGTVYFGGYDREHGRELWKTNGTPNGTVLVKDINPGSGDGLRTIYGVVNGVVFFAGMDGTKDDPWHFGTLWRSDGSPDGTEEVADVRPSGVVNVNGTLFFFNNETELWRSNGTRAGTQQVTNVEEAGCFWKELGPSLAAANGRLYFIAEGLWTSDGTAAGTVRLTEGCPDPAFIAVNGSTFFLATDDRGTELWRTDGTIKGTRRVKDINHGPADAFFENGGGAYTYSPLFTEVDGTLFFLATDGVAGFELWKSDGTEEGTVLVSDVVPGPAGITACDFLDEYDDQDCLPSLVAANGTLFFTGIEAEHGRELWKSDGTADGTVLVVDSIPGPESGDPTQVTNADGTIYFTIWDEHGSKLWRTDRTASGTTLVSDLNVARVVAVGRSLFLLVRNDETGLEPWWSAGGSPPFPLKDIFRGNRGSFPSELTNLRGTLFFTADDGVHGREVWRTDATASNTALVADVWPGPNGSLPADLTPMYGALFFAADDGVHGSELWRSDGTAEGTVLFKDVNPGQRPSTPRSLIVVGDVLFFRADDGVHGVELWRSDGTAAGTVLVADVLPGVAGGLDLESTYHWKNRRDPLVELKGILLFSAQDGSSDQYGNPNFELWRSDGTAGGTRLVLDVNTGPAGSFPDMLTTAGGVAFFTPELPTYGELWRTDGTAEGTVRILGVTGSLGGLTNLDGELFFSEYDWDDDVNRLWRSDGSVGGTLPIAEVLGFIGNIVRARDVFFTESYSWWDHTLWRTDGAPEGTRPTHGFAVDSFSVGSVAQRLVIGASSYHSLWLWTSDGTDAGTVPLQDISRSPDAPDGNYFEDPPQFVSAGGKVFFTSAHGGFGREIWALRVSALKPVAPLDSPTPTAPPNETPTPTPSFTSPAATSTATSTPTDRPAGAEPVVSSSGGCQIEPSPTSGWILLVAATGLSLRRRRWMSRSRGERFGM